MIDEYSGEICEYCDGAMCDRMGYKDELKEMLQDVGLHDGSIKELRFIMYRKFTLLKHGLLGKKNRREICYCVNDIILHTFPLEKGQRKCGFEAIKNNHD